MGVNATGVLRPAGGLSSMEDCIPVGIAQGEGNSSWVYENQITAGNSWKQTNFSTADPVFDISMQQGMEEAEDTLYSRVVVCICVAGLVGNILNMTVLTHRRLRTGMSEIEGTVYLGLAALAVSDMMFCACALPHGWVQPRFYYEQASFSLFYTLYSGAFINIFVMCSVWFTVTMAMSRYVAICYPLHARSLISRKRAYQAGAVIFGLSVVCNLPRFWKQTIDTMACVGDWSVYYLATGIFHERPKLFYTYTCAYFLVGTVIPFSALVFCNLRLVAALRKSYKHQEDLGQNVRCMDQSGICRITLTLVLIIAMYMVLVVPVEVSTFVRDVVTSYYTSYFNLALAILNVMQASNFAFHFVLYCIVNVHFRKTVKHVFKCATFPGRVAASFKEKDCQKHSIHTEHLNSPCRPVVTHIL